MAFRNRFNNLSLYLIAACLTLLVLVLIMYAPNFNYATPLTYSGDSLWCCAMIKSIMDTHTYTNSNFLSAPSILNFGVYPVYTPFLYFATRFFSFFVKDLGSILNTIYYATYFLSTLFSLFAFRQIGLNKPFALVASLLFSFIPYHIMRGEDHLLINTIFAAPIFILLAITTYDSNDFFSKKNIGLCVLCIIASCSSSAGYFVYFGCYLLLIAGTVGSIEKQKWAPFLSALIFIIISCTTFLISISPKFINDLHNGTNQAIFERGPGGAELYSLKMTQLLFPNDWHRISVLKDFKNKYNLAAPLINENTTASLGMMGAAGFLILLFSLFLKKFQSANNNLFVLSILNLGSLLLSMTGGIGSIISFSITHMFRGYNRISIFIAFLSLAGFFITLQLILNKISATKNKILFYLLASILLTFGLLDEIPIIPEKMSLFEQNKNLYSSDDEFIKQIETIMPPSSLIFQLPFIHFPAGGIVNKLTEYQHFRPYLHSRTLHWSYGAYTGTRLAEWQESVSEKPVEELVKEIGAAGFSGIYINREGYLDNGARFEKGLRDIVHLKPIVSHDNTMVFYDLRPYLHQLKENDPLAWNKKIKHTHQMLALEFSWSKGFSNLEKDGKISWRWCGKKGCIKIINTANQNLPIIINFKLQTPNSLKANIYITGDLIEENIKLPAQNISFSKKLLLTPGDHKIIFKTNATKVNANEDPRLLYFKLIDFSVDPNN